MTTATRPDSKGWRATCAREGVRVVQVEGVTCGHIWEAATVVAEPVKFVCPECSQSAGRTTARRVRVVHHGVRVCTSCRTNRLSRWNRSDACFACQEEARQRDLERIVREAEAIEALRAALADGGPSGPRQREVWMALPGTAAEISERLGRSRAAVHSRLAVLHRGGFVTSTGSSAGGWGGMTYHRVET